jgi:hypothetical protein
LNRDYELLVEILDDIEAILKQLVHDDGDYVLIEFARDDRHRNLLGAAWTRARSRLEHARQLLSSLQVFKAKPLTD